MDTAHCLPCKIDYEGPAPVSDYFLVTNDQGKSQSNQDHDLDSLKATFRGRQLKASLLQHPQYQLSQWSTQTMEDRTVLKKEKVFPQCYIWDHDQLPTSDHPILRTLDYVDMMNQVSHEYLFIL
jgi:hypothetical protein